jgi:hypothetical protein
MLGIKFSLVQALRNKQWIRFSAQTQNNLSGNLFAPSQRAVFPEKFLQLIDRFWHFWAASDRQDRSDHHAKNPRRIDLRIFGLVFCAPKSRAFRTLALYERAER